MRGFLSSKVTVLKASIVPSLNSLAFALLPGYDSVAEGIPSYEKFKMHKSNNDKSSALKSFS
jgi:hypothetical protein